MHFMKVLKEHQSITLLWPYWEIIFKLEHKDTSYGKVKNLKKVKEVRMEVELAQGVKEDFKVILEYLKMELTLCTILEQEQLKAKMVKMVFQVKVDKVLMMV
jgi:hypothetical protein